MTTILVIYLLVLGVYDIRYQKLPLVWMIAGGVMALVSMIWQWYTALGMTADTTTVITAWAVTEAAAETAGGTAVAVNIIKSWLPGLLLSGISKITGKVGNGDGCVLLIVGSILGSRDTYLAFAISLMLAAVWAAGLLIFHKAGRKDRIPYIPFITTAVLLVAAH